MHSRLTPVNTSFVVLLSSCHLLLTFVFDFEKQRRGAVAEEALLQPFRASPTLLLKILG